MAFKIGYANGHKALLIAVKGFLCDAKKAYNIAAGVGHTGDGYVSAERASTSPVDETWTLTATSATNFTVTGSVSGAQAAATVGTPYDNTIVAFTIIAGDTAFVSSDSFTFDVADGLGATEKYTAMRWDTDYDAVGGYELVLKGPGTTGTDEIFSAIQTVENAGDDYYNWRMMGMTSYADVEMKYIPGITKGRLPRLLMWAGPIKYWLIANGRRFVLQAKISSVYQPCYLGFPLPTGLPTQFPYPLIVGGAACPSATAALNRYSSTDNSHRGFPNSYADAAGVCIGSTFDYTSEYSTLKVLQGTSWNRILSASGASSIGGTNIVWPYSSSYYQIFDTAPYHPFSTLLRENLDGSYPVLPTDIIISSPSNNNFGFMQGVFAVPGFGGIAAEDTFDIAGVTYVAFPIVPNANRANFWALKLE